jgi:hypothetical protein
MEPASLAFFGELAVLAKTAGSGLRTTYPVMRQASVKDVIEALGVPHTEVYRIETDGREADFGHLLAPGERVDVFPANPPVDVAVPTLLRPEGYPRGRFLVDVNVNKLATLLRLLGFDAAGADSRPDARVAESAAAEKRVLLSRDKALLRRKNVFHGRLIRSAEPEGQLRETLAFFGLAPPYVPFKRCLRCNLPLTPVSKQDVLSRLLPKTKRYFDEFHICPGCNRIYWPGSHHDKMLMWLEELEREMEENRGKNPFL